MLIMIWSLSVIRTGFEIFFEILVGGLVVRKFFEFSGGL